MKPGRSWTRYSPTPHPTTASKWRGYVVGVSFWNKQRIEGVYLFRNAIVIRAKLSDNGWEVRYNMADDAWAENTGREVDRNQTGMYIPCTSAKGFKAKLRLQAHKLA